MSATPSQPLRKAPGGVATDGRDAPLLRHALARFEEASARRGAEPAWLAERRREALTRLTETGFPSVRDEDGRFTNPGPIVRGPFRTPGSGVIDDEAVAQHPRVVEALGLVPAPAARLVFLDGRLWPSFSHGTTAPWMGVPPRFGAASLAQAIARSPEALAPHLAHGAAPASSAFVALNQALFEDGALVWLAREASVAAPVHVVFVSLGVQDSHARMLVVAEAGSRGSVVETHVFLGGAETTGFTSAVTEVVCGAHARVDHVRVLRGSEGSLHVGAVRAQVAQDGAFGSLSLAFGGRLSRVDVDVVLAGEGATCALDGLYVAGGKEHVDHHTRIDHAVPRCTSRELYKGVLDGESTAVFAGRIQVRENAQKTDARQASHTLLLSQGATVDAKPELEIFADDVKCAHGATVGEMDDEAVFYLRSRGIDLTTARAMLVHAFAAEVLQRASPAVAPERLEEMLAGRLPGADGAPEGAA